MEEKEQSFMEQATKNIAVGRNAIRELLADGQPIDKIFVLRGEASPGLSGIISEARARGIPVNQLPRDRMDRLSGGVKHQGIAAQLQSMRYYELDELLQIAADRGEKPLLVIADGIEDPHNLGALSRCADGAGAHGIIIAKNRTCGYTQAAIKASAGAAAHMPVARVVNLSRTLDELKKAGLWIFAAEAGGQSYDACDMNLPAAFIFGSEGKGVSRLLKEKSDFIVSIPMYGKVNSLNVSTAAAVLLCEAARQRHSVTG